MSRKLIAGNWKMNMTRAEGVALASELATRLKAAAPAGFDMLVCPPATLVAPVAEALAGSGVAVGGQDCSAHDKGAHTGDTSAVMFKDLGAGYVLVGHSERRTDHKETDAEVAAKAQAAWRSGLVAVICIGETEGERDAGKALSVCSTQLAGSIPAGATSANTVIAYEPVWAIGTGRTPTAADVAEVHAHIRKELSGKVDDPAATRVLYGGSVKPSNAAELLSVANVDGALVGGASLKADDFWGIAAAV
jgi:triosephosphate isomerase (TIM)